MSYSIIYSTHTDNIIKLAGQIEAALPKEEIIFDGRIEAVEDFAIKADVILLDSGPLRIHVMPKLRNCCLH